MEKDLICGRVRDAGYLRDEQLPTMRFVILTVRYEVFVSKKGSVELSCVTDNKVQLARSKPEATTRSLAKRKAGRKDVELRDNYLKMMLRRYNTYIIAK